MNPYSLEFRSPKLKKEYFEKTLIENVKILSDI